MFQSWLTAYIGLLRGLGAYVKTKKPREMRGKLAFHPYFPGFLKRRARDSNPQPLTGYLSSNEAAHQLAYPPTQPKIALRLFGLFEIGVTPTSLR